jgi:uncharacterized damage-inducible protein DinB
MSKSQFQTLFAYHWHTTRQLLECAARLSDAEYKDNPGYGHGSIHDLLFHLLRSARNWRLTLESGQQPVSLKVEDFPGLESLQTGFAGEQAAWEGYLSALGEAEIDEAMELTNRRGETHLTPRWRALEHVVLHGMQHHSELAQLLTAKGQSPGNIDFIFYE